MLICAYQFCTLLFEKLLASLDALFVLANVRLEFIRTFFVKPYAALRALNLGTQFLGLRTQTADGGFDRVVGLSRLVGFRLGSDEAALEVFDLGSQCAHLRRRLGLLASELHKVFVRLVSIQRSQVLNQALIATRLCCLSLKRAHLPLHLRNDVSNTQQIRLRKLQLPQRFFLLSLKLRDARCLFKDRPTILRFRTQEHVDLPLRHDRVRSTSNACARKEIMYILETAHGAVHAILPVPIPENATADGHFIVVHAQGPLAVRKCQHDFRHAHCLALVSAIKNDVRHFGAAQGLCRSLPQHPADRIDDVGLAATVRAHDACHALVKFKVRLVSKGLEAVNGETLEIHRWRRKGFVTPGHPALKVRREDARNDPYLIIQRPIGAI